MDYTDKQPIFFSCPADTSLAAYQNWIRGMAAALGGVDDLTQAEWEERWRQFWGMAPADATQKEL